MQSDLYTFAIAENDPKPDLTVTIDRSGRNLPRGEHISGEWRPVGTLSRDLIPEIYFQDKAALELLDSNQGFCHLEWKYRREHPFWATLKL
jgi:hypothetical protein